MNRKEIMNFFIDFDNTLFNTPMLSKIMFEKLAVYISNNCNINYGEILEKIHSKFGRDENQIFDIYELIKYFAPKFNFNEQEATNAVNEVIFNCKEYVYEDVIEFLENLRKNKHKIYIISYNEKKVYYQTVKIAGSGLLKYVDGLMTTTVLKGDMPLNFEKGIFIDDKPTELIKIYQNQPFKVFRIRRPGSKFDNIEIDEPIPEFKNLKELTTEIDKIF